MRFVAQEADRFFGRRGEVREVDHYLEWYDGKARAFVGVVNEGESARVRVILDRSPRFLGGAGVVGVVGLLTVAGFLAEGGAAGGIGAILAAVVSLAVIAGFWRWQASAARSRIDALLDLMSLPGG